jgi:hypothetical protein
MAHQSPDTLLFADTDAAPLAVSAAQPLPVTDATGAVSFTITSPETLLFAGPDGSPVVVSRANPIPVIAV